MDRAASRSGASTRSSFIRGAVLERVAAIEESRVVEIRDVSEKEAMRLIDEYLKKHPGVHYTSDLADELGIELGVAFAAAETLIEKGRARVGRE
jgi:uncharacterized protein (DUF1778 family)